MCNWLNPFKLLLIDSVVVASETSSSNITCWHSSLVLHYYHLKSFLRLCIFTNPIQHCRNSWLWLVFRQSASHPYIVCDHFVFELEYILSLLLPCFSVLIHINLISALWNIEMPIRFFCKMVKLYLLLNWFRTFTGFCNVFRNECALWVGCVVCVQTTT